MLLQNRINSINSQISTYLEEIAKLQAKVTQLQTHAQEVQGAEAAAESALAQIDTAIAMLEAICPDEIAIFKAAIDAKFKPSLPQLTATIDIDAAIPENTTPPVAPDDSNVGEVIETTAIAVEDAETDIDISDDTIILPESDANISDSNDTDSEPQESKSNIVDVEIFADTESDRNPDGNGNSNGNGSKHHLLNYDQLKLVDRPTLIKLANKYNIENYKSRKRDELANLLDGLITQQELAEAKNGKHQQ